MPQIERTTETIIREYYYFYYSASRRSATYNINISGDWTYEITQGGNLVIVEKDNSGNIVVTPKPGTPGGEVVIVVTDQNGNTHTYTITVVQRPGQTFTQNITGQQTATVTVGSTDSYQVTKGSDLVTVRREGNNLVVTPNQGANGRAVIEVKNSQGVVTTRYIPNITPVAPQVNEIVQNITDTAELSITVGAGATHTITEGSDLINATREGNVLIVKTVQGANGQAIIELKDANGSVTVRYILYITPAMTEANVIERTITNKQIIELIINSTNTLHIVEGGTIVRIEKNGSVHQITPNEGAEGRVVIEERDVNGNVVVRYIVTVTQDTETPSEPSVDVISIPTGGTTTITIGQQGNTLDVISGGGLAVITPGANGGLTVDPRPGAQGDIVVHEKDSEGNVIRIITIKVNEPGEFQEPGGGITIDDVSYTVNPDGTITVTVPEGGGRIIIIRGEASVAEGSKPGEWIITPDDGYEGPIEFGIEGQDGSRIVNVNVTNNFGSAGEGSSAQGASEGSSSPTCIGTGLLTALPLLALIPVGLATQVNIPGMEGLRAQVDAAIREANTQFQQGFGIFNDDLAQQMNAALGFDIRPVVSISAAGLGLAAAGIILSEALLRACGMEEMTLSGQLSSDTGGSSGDEGGSSLGSSDPAIKE